MPTTCGFEAMFEQVMSFQNGEFQSNRCAAIPRGKTACQENAIILTESALQNIPESLANVGFSSAVQLLELMLCPVHHSKPLYTTKLLNDWYTATGQNNPSLHQALQRLLRSSEEEWKRLSRRRTNELLDPSVSHHPRSTSEPPPGTRLPSPPPREEVGIENDPALDRDKVVDGPSPPPSSTEPSAQNPEEQAEMPSAAEDLLLQEFQHYQNKDDKPNEVASVILDLHTAMEEAVDKRGMTCIAQDPNGSRCKIILALQEIQKACCLVAELRAAVETGGRPTKSDRQKLRRKLPIVTQCMLCSVHFRFNGVYVTQYMKNEFELHLPQIPAWKHNIVKPINERRRLFERFYETGDQVQVNSGGMPSVSSLSVSSEAPTPDSHDSTSTSNNEGQPTTQSHQSSEPVNPPGAGEGEQSAPSLSIPIRSIPTPVVASASTNEDGPNRPALQPSSEVTAPPLEPNQQEIPTAPRPGEPRESDSLPAEVSFYLRYQDSTSKLYSIIRTTENPLAWVYVYQSPNVQNLIKIGVTIKPGDERLKEITKCKCGCKFGDVYEVQSYPVPALQYKKVEDLCHAELANFNCTNVKYTGEAVKVSTHQEWFWVPPAVAQKSVERWQSFVKAAYTPVGTLTELWSERVGEFLQKGTPQEEKAAFERGLKSHDFAEYHMLRNQRLDDWLKKESQPS